MTSPVASHAIDLNELFHPAVATWFARRFPAPSAPQVPAWRAVRAGNHTLIAAPTGSGKTLAAFLAAVDDLVRAGDDGPLPDETRVLYVSPLKALGNDIHRNLEEPLAGIRHELASLGRLDHGIRVLVRSGDTPQHVRQAMTKRPPHIVVTTPESLYLLLTSDGGRRMLRTVRTVIVDEIHAVVGTKRGTHLALSLERLRRLAGGTLQRIGLSATQDPIEDVARFLVGATCLLPDGTPDCAIVDAGLRREFDLAVEVPSSPLEAVMATDVWKEVYDRLAELIGEHRTTLVFVNTRRLAERVARHLGERIGEEHVASHHGSLSKEHRLRAERRLKAGELKALVATASLELGIDIGDVDLVCQVSSTASIATFLQRVGRSGHFAGGLPKGRIFPLSRDELVESAALFDAIRRGEPDRLTIPENALDILAQHIVAACAVEEWREEDLYATVRAAWPYRALPRADFDAVVRMLANGFQGRRGRRIAYLFRDPVTARLRARRGARLTAVTSGGAIPDNADYPVVEEPGDLTVGSVNEDFAVESSAGDIFQLGNTSWRILRLDRGTVRVENAHGAPPTIPFWFGEAPARSRELSRAVSRLRTEVERRLGIDAEDAEAGAPREAAVAETARWLEEDLRLSEGAAEQLVEYLAAGRVALGAMPTHETIVLERFFDETGGMQLVLHAPFGSRVNRAWGLALRKRFCRKFNFELQAAATEDAVILSLGPTHSFPLEEVFHYLQPATVRDVLVQALLLAPMFAVRWRWNAGCALAIPRFRGGKKVPSPIQRMQAEDLLAVVFPDQLACAENLSGDREIPDHPLATQTVRDCLEEATDLAGLQAILEAIRANRLRLIAKDLREPSPFAAEILAAKPYAFLDDAPLEERRTQAVMGRRWLDAESAAELGALDADAIARVREEARPEAGDPDELHDALAVAGFLTEGEVSGMADGPALIRTLRDAGRGTRVAPPAATGDTGAPAGRSDTPEPFWIAVDRVPQARALFPHLRFDPELALPPALAAEAWDADTALTEMLRARLEITGPVTETALARSLGATVGAAAAALARLEAEGAIFQGRYTPGAAEREWCERRLLARIHRLTLDRLRRSIEPVSARDFMRFLFNWHDLADDARPTGRESLAVALDRLEGFEAPAAAWEGDILPARLESYDPADLDGLCLAGRTVWSRLTPPAAGSRAAGPVKGSPVAFLSRRNAPLWRRTANAATLPELSSAAASVRQHLKAAGASFFDELVEGTSLLRTQVEAALAELAAWGLVTADSFAGLRALLVPEAKKKRARRRGFSLEDAGRWSLPERARTADAEDGAPSKPDLEPIARALLMRYGVVFRRVLERESALPPWRDLLRVYRRLEARGEIRGGRFVGGFTGEQYALPEAVERLRTVRRREPDGRLVALSAADPLNLAGILTPGAKVAALAGNRVLYRDGEPAAARVAGETRWFLPLDEREAWAAGEILVRRAVPPALRPWLGAPR